MSLVAIVGRPNVGKSTLFNRLTERRQAIIFEAPGSTRDRQYGEVNWCGHQFTLIDTGGYLDNDTDPWSAPIRRQVLVALEEADILLFLLDCKTGLLPGDESIAHLLRRTNQRVIVVVNKVDHAARALEVASFYKLALSDQLFEVSAINGSGTGELLDEIVTHLPSSSTSDHAALPEIGILGRPNTGKSTLLNALVGQERTIVSEQSGTTRDAISVLYKQFGKELILVDTAGIRKRAKVKEQVEFFSTLRALSVLQNIDVCLLLLDANLGLQAQDLHLLSLAGRYHKGLLLCINKWDLIQKDTHTQSLWVKKLTAQLGALSYAGLHFCSALHKSNIYQLLEHALSIYHQRKRHISTSQLNEQLLPVIEQRPPPARKGKRIRIKYITQLKKPYPHFIFFANLPQYIDKGYHRLMVRSIRSAFGFEGVPVSVSFRKK